MDNSATVITAVALGLFMLLTRAVMPGHKLTVYGTLEAFQHIAVGFLIAAAIYVEGLARIVVLGCLILPTIFEVIMFMKGPKRDETAV